MGGCHQLYQHVCFGTVDCSCRDNKGCVCHPYAFPRVFPMLGDKYPMEIYAMSPSGRLIMYIAVQSMKHGKFTQPDVCVWWPKTEQEFNKVKKIFKVYNAQIVWKKVD